MDEHSLEQLLSSHTTPMYVFDLGKLEKRVRFLRQRLPEQVGLCFAVKANPFLAKQMSRLVDRLEICSPGEFSVCHRLNLSPEQFVISGVHKDAGFIGDMVARALPEETFTAESTAQFALLQRAAEACGRRIRVLLRLTSGNQFGLDERDLEEILASNQHDPWIDIRGIQFFSGTQKESIKRLRREIQYLDGYLQSLRDKYGFGAEELEFGPGLPVAYFQGDPFDEEAFLREFSQLLREMRFPGKIILELGRSMTADCGCYLTRVVDTKENHGSNYAIVDGGSHQITYYGAFMAMKKPFLRLLSPGQNRAPGAWNICGSLCTSNDILVKQAPLGELRPGDVLVFEKAGAYCMTEGMSLFLSRDLPEILFQNPDGTFTTVRDRVLTDRFNTPNESKER